MDFGTGGWDVSSEADHLTQSLFGGSKQNSEKAIKRKVEVTSEKPSKSKKPKPHTEIQKHGGISNNLNTSQDDPLQNALKKPKKKRHRRKPVSEKNVNDDGNSENATSIKGATGKGPKVKDATPHTVAKSVNGKRPIQSNTDGPVKKKRNRKKVDKSNTDAASEKKAPADSDVKGKKKVPADTDAAGKKKVPADTDATGKKKVPADVDVKNEIKHTNTKSTEANTTSTVQEINQETKAVSVKKKRKRICKRNKFKDYSKEEELKKITQVEISDKEVTGVPANSDNKVTGSEKSAKKRKRKNKNNSDDLKKETQVEVIDKIRSGVPVNSNHEAAGSETPVRKKKRKRKNNEKIDKSSIENAEETSQNITQHGSGNKKVNNNNNSELKTQTVKPSVGSASKPKYSKSKFNAAELGALLSKSQKGLEGDRPDAKKANNKLIDNNASEVAKSGKPTTLLEKSKARLKAARFRYINEQLYTTTGDEAFEMFREDSEAFQVYHEGFQSQVEKWPTNPIDLIIEYVKTRPKHMVVADFGCGDAKLSNSVANKVHSFDLVALNDRVTVCDMSKVPLKDASVDIAVYCLSLMGTNLPGYLAEANRVLKQGGVMKVAEVSSRFSNLGAFIMKVEKMGFKVINQDSDNKMFVMMDFRKTTNIKGPLKLDIQLNPCVYKKR